MCIGCTQCVRVCPHICIRSKAKQIVSVPRTENCLGCKRCESAGLTNFVSVRVYLWHETTRSYVL